MIVRRMKLLWALAGAAALGLAVTAGASAAGGKLTLVAYSTPAEAYKALIPAFQRTPAGKGWTVGQSYGASGDQSRAVEQGLGADVVEFSLEPDITRLVRAGLVNPEWNQVKYRGIVTRSVVVFAVRKGNPKHIRSWADLTKPGIEVITPNAITSGGARWNILAAYGAQRKLGKSDRQAQDYLRELFKHVSVQDKSARESLQTFSSGKGDVLLAYENEAIFAQKHGEKLDYVVPRETILIENPAAVVQTSKNRKEAQAFLSFLSTPKAQTIFGQNGYRPVVPSVLAKFKRYKRPAGLFTINQLGGWDLANKTFFDPTNGIVAKVQHS